MCCGTGSYHELERRAEGLAAVWRRGARVRWVVAVLAERSAELPALLAVRKTGVAYCRPVYPAERLAYMLRSRRPAARRPGLRTTGF